MLVVTKMIVVRKHGPETEKPITYSHRGSADLATAIIEFNGAYSHYVVDEDATRVLLMGKMLSE